MALEIPEEAVADENGEETAVVDSKALTVSEGAVADKNGEEKARLTTTARATRQDLRNNMAKCRNNELLFGFLVVWSEEVVVIVVVVVL